MPTRRAKSKSGSRADVLAYASRTGTAENIELMRAHGWRMLVSAANDLRHEGMPYALDNGAWSYHQKGLPFDELRAGAHSFDGTSVTKYARTNIERLDAARREDVLIGDPIFGDVVECFEAQCDDPRDYEADARLVHDELPTYRDDEEVILCAGALRRLIAIEQGGTV